VVVFDDCHFYEEITPLYQGPRTGGYGISLQVLFAVPFFFLPTEASVFHHYGLPR